MENLVTLISTFHLDIHGERRIKNALRKIKPEIVIAESNEALDQKAGHRHAIWTDLFDYLDLSEEVRYKFFAYHSYKEHIVTKQYAELYEIPFFMVDVPEETNSQEMAEYAQEDLIYMCKTALPRDKAAFRLAQIIDSDYAHHYFSQEKMDLYATVPPTRKQLELINDRDPHMAKKILEVISFNPDKIILGFFGNVHLYPPDTSLTRINGLPLMNLRYFLGEQGITYRKLDSFH